MPYHRPKSPLRRRWSHGPNRMQLLQSLDAERRWAITRHRALWTVHTSCTAGCRTRRIPCRSCHGHLVGWPCMVAVVVVVGTRKLMGHYCLSTLSRLHASPACVISITTLPSNDLCIRALLSVSAAVSHRVCLEK